MINTKFNPIRSFLILQNGQFTKILSSGSNNFFKNFAKWIPVNTGFLFKALELSFTLAIKFTHDNKKAQNRNSLMSFIEAVHTIDILSLSSH